MASLNHLVVGRLMDGVSFSRRLAQVCSHGSSRVLGSARDQAARGGSSKVLAYVTSINVPLTKISHMANPVSSDGEPGSPFVRRSRILRPFFAICHNIYVHQDGPKVSVHLKGLESYRSILWTQLN